MVVGVWTSIGSVALVDVEAVDPVAAEAVETIALKRSNCVCTVGELAAGICVTLVDVVA